MLASERVRAFLPSILTDTPASISSTQGNPAPLSPARANQHTPQPSRTVCAHPAAVSLPVHTCNTRTRSHTHTQSHTHTNKLTPRNRTACAHPAAVPHAALPAGPPGLAPGSGAARTACTCPRTWRTRKVLYTQRCTHNEYGIPYHTVPYSPVAFYSGVLRAELRWPATPRLTQLHNKPSKPHPRPHLLPGAAARRGPGGAVCCCCAACMG